MLAKVHRLTSAADFSSTIRQGGRSGSGTLVAHLAVPDLTLPDAAHAAPARVGLVVNKGVGNAVTRNLVKRRLRHVARNRVDGLPAGSLLVIRALPEAAGASSAQLDLDLEHTLTTTLTRVRSRGRRS